MATFSCPQGGCCGEVQLYKKITIFIKSCYCTQFIQKQTKQNLLSLLSLSEQAAFTRGQDGHILLFQKQRYNLETGYTLAKWEDNFFTSSIILNLGPSGIPKLCSRSSVMQDISNIPTCSASKLSANLCYQKKKNKKSIFNNEKTNSNTHQTVATEKNNINRPLSLNSHMELKLLAGEQWNIGKRGN